MNHCRGAGRNSYNMGFHGNDSTCCAAQLDVTNVIPMVIMEWVENIEPSNCPSVDR